MRTEKIMKVWTFKSSSSDNTYQTLQYEDDSTSCNCPGWTRHVARDGTRSCKHTRAVDMGTADSEAVAMKDYGNGKPIMKFEKPEPTSGRKVRWQ